MKTRIEYGAYVNDEYITMTRQQWLVAVRINFPGEDMDNIKRLIRTERRQASKLPLYTPAENTGWNTPGVVACYHDSNGRKWLYVHKDNKQASVLHAVVKYCRKFGIDDSFMEWNDEAEGDSYLDPSYVPEKKDFDVLSDELTEINYHSEAGVFSDLAGAFIDLIEKHGNLLEVKMGQYHKLYNVDKKEYVYDHRIDNGLKLMEQC